MNCTDFRSWIEKAVESRETIDGARASNHLRECSDPACRSLLESTVRLNSAIDAWQATTPRVDVSGPVVARFVEEREREVAASNGRPSVRVDRQNHSVTGGGDQSRLRWAAIVAALVLGVSLFAVWSRGPTGGNEIAGPSSERGESVVSDPPAPGAPEVAPDAPRDVGDSYVNIARSATSTVTDLVVLTFGGDVEEIEDPSPGAEWVDDWQERIGPMGGDVGDALDRFFDTIPESAPAT